MKAGQVTEITPTNIKKWGDAQLEKIDEKEYWTIIVDYTTKTMFGDFDTQAQARVFGGKVEKWIYTGSGEVVP
jgi:endo-alpha-1,4-polygalactosaminidase (GH114 family)